MLQVLEWCVACTGLVCCMYWTDVLHAIGGSTIFSKINLLHAYLKMELDEGVENSARSTFTGGYIGIADYHLEFLLLLPFGNGGIPKILYLLDDIIMVGATEEEHFRIIEEVLARLDQYGMTLNKAKCTLFKSEKNSMGI